ncbi:MAG: hypothetical protein FJ319_10100 [SAR202 cluster bacterium]|nr:hypothetical protein [SAR202 cluster bacterium]
MTRVLLSLALLIAIAACSSPAASTATPTPGGPMSITQIKYFLIGKYPDFFFCDPDYYPVSREGQEESRAKELFMQIRADQEMFGAITSRLGIAGRSDYSDAQKLQIYREYKKLNALGVEPVNGNFRYDFRANRAGNGLAISGIVDQLGAQLVHKEEPTVVTCPICLPGEAMIDTPSGPVAVSAAFVGMPIWTMDPRGQKVQTTVAATGKVPSPAGHKMVRIELADGRTLTVSPGHPSADGRPIGHYSKGFELDGSAITSITFMDYTGNERYDILPNGTTGLYWANGILVQTTISLKPLVKPAR